MKKKIWLVCKITYIVLIIITFSPLVLSSGETCPHLWGMPRVLWSGLLISLIFIIITLVGALVLNSENKKR